MKQSSGRYLLLVGAVSFVLMSVCVFGQQEEGKTAAGKSDSVISFRSHVMPIFKKNCLPCHAEDNMNPSDLSLDSYDLLMAGGKHGDVAKPGKAGESVLVKKLSADPPFGDRMPLDPKKKRGTPSTMKLSDEDIKTIADWIDQGAKDN
jgi:hypothetical protein